MSSCVYEIPRLFSLLVLACINKITLSVCLSVCGPVVGHSLWTRPARVQSPWEAIIIRCKNLALYIRDCESLCLSDETVKAVGPFYLVATGEVKDPTQGVNV